jgi:diguanylate cyclase (GGDEF)-like protein
MEPLIAVLLLASLNAALLAWAARSDRVTVHWPRRLVSAYESLRSRRPAADLAAGRRRRIVAEPGSSGAADCALPAAVRPSLAETLPPDLAELLSRPASVGPEAGGSGPDGAGQPEPAIMACLPPDRSEPCPGLGIDPLTGLEGPLGWSRLVEVENARLLRYRRPVTVVMIEVEGLQRLVDRLGEEPAERLLPVIAEALRREARTSDWVARVGDGRFAALLPETDEIQAINYVERVRVACEPWLASAAVPLRLTIGWASPAAATDLESALSRAEERMHADRRLPGRSFQAPRVVLARVIALPIASPDVVPAEDLVGLLAEPEPIAARSRGRRKAMLEAVVDESAQG